MGEDGRREREGGDRITSRLLLRVSGCIVVPVTEMGNLGRGAVWVRREGVAMPGLNVLSFKVPVGYAGRFPGGPLVLMLFIDGVPSK